MRLRYSFLLPAAATAMSVVSTIEVTTATIGLEDRTLPAPSASTSTEAISTWATGTAVRTGSLSVASRNNLNQCVDGNLCRRISRPRILIFESCA